MANLICNSEGLNSFPIKLGTKQRSPQRIDKKKFLKIKTSVASS